MNDKLEVTDGLFLLTDNGIVMDCAVTALNLSVIGTSSRADHRVGYA
jgi:hypothetical protein